VAPAYDKLPLAHRSPVVVVSASRSGSTLLQRVLNTHTKLTIWGEHFGLLSPLMRSLRLAQRDEANLARGFKRHTNILTSDPAALADEANPHLNPFDAAGYQDFLATSIVELFAGGLPDDVRWGFKEIRYSKPDLVQMERLFPELRVIVLARRPADQISSMLRAPWRPYHDSNDPGQRAKMEAKVARMASNWHTQYASLHEYALTSPGRVLRVGYGDLSTDRMDVDALFGHLGIEPPPRAAVEQVLAKKVGSSDRSKGWNDADKELVYQLITEYQWPEGHDEIIASFGSSL